MAEKQSKWRIFTAGIIRENPVLRLVLGCCSALAVTTTVSGALGMGLAMTFVLVCSNIVISALRKVIPAKVHLPCYIVIIATFVTIVKMVAEAFVPELYTGLGVFISLLVVNCIVLGRAEAFAKKNSVFDSFLDALGNGVGYIIAILIIAAVREILGNGTITFGAVFTFIPKVSIPVLKFDNVDLSISLFAKPAGGFIVYGVIEAIIAAVNVSKAQKEAALKKAALLKAQAEKAAAQKAKLAQEAK